MKKSTKFLIIATLTCFLTFGQSAKLNDIVEFKMKNSGSIFDQNNEVDGYYFFYQVDKLSKGKREYAIRILDDNLNTVATKSIIGTRGTTLLASAYNNEEIAFVFGDFNEKQFRFVTFDKKGNKSKDVFIPIKKKSIKWIKMIEQMGYDELLSPVDNQGFLLSLVTKNAKIGYNLEFISSNEKVSSWNYSSPTDSKEWYMIKPIKTSNNYIVALQTRKKSLLSKKLTNEAIVIDINTGKITFKVDLDNGTNAQLITNAFIENDEVILLGEYFEKGANVFKDKSMGLFVDSYDGSTGNLVMEKKVSWENQLFSKLQSIKGDIKKRSYVYFHKVIKTKGGDYYAIGEQYRRTTTAGSIAKGLLGGSSGAYSQLTITDAVIFKFDKEFVLIDVQVFEKGKSNAPSISDFGSPQLNAHVLKAYGAFDFEFVQIDLENDRFYANFIDYVREGKHRGERAFKSIIYNNGKLSEDKIYLKNKRKIKFRVFPAKLGHVVIIEYNKKEKSIELHLEKLNIE